jgi:AcrR family transcriptional regulator
VGFVRTAALLDCPDHPRPGIVTWEAEDGIGRGHTQQEAGVPGALYHFFPGGKTSLAKAVLTESGAAYQALFELIAEESDGPADAVRAFFDGAADALEQGDFVDICPVGTVAGEVASTHDVLRVACDRVFVLWTEALAVRLERELTSRDANALATTIVATLLGAFVLARCRRDPAPLRVAGQRMGQAVKTEIAAARARRGAPSLSRLARSSPEPAG